MKSDDNSEGVVAVAKTYFITNVTSGSGDKKGTQSMFAVIESHKRTDSDL